MVYTSFGYNPASQIISRAVNRDDYQIEVPFVGDTDYTHNVLNQYTKVGTKSLTYDTNGNLKTYDGWTYAYNAHNRMTSASKSGTALTLAYDAAGTLQSSTLNGTKTTFLYDGNELIAEYNASGAVINRYVHGIGEDDPLVWYIGSGTSNKRYLIADERGSIMAETSTSGSVLAKHQYGPFGEPVDVSTARFRYTGQILIPGTKLYYYKARFYHPELGRFMQTDPIGYKDGMNWYAYVGNDPLNRAVPSGLSSSDTFMDIINSVKRGIFSEAVKARSDAKNAASETKPMMDEAKSDYLGPRDAIRHCVLACSLTQRVARDKASKLLEDHEIDSGEPDSMDDMNNQLGMFLGETSELGQCAASCEENKGELMTRRGLEEEPLKNPIPIKNVGTKDEN